MNIHEYAETEMNRAWPETDPMQDMMKQNVLEIVDVFNKQGHSGMSASYVLGVIDRVLRFLPISPLTGDEDEWGAAYGDDDTQQNLRCSKVFRAHHDNSTAHNIEGKVFSTDGGETYFSNRNSSVPVSFPYYPPLYPEFVILESEKARK